MISFINQNLFIMMVADIINIYAWKAFFIRNFLTRPPSFFYLKNAFLTNTVFPAVHYYFHSAVGYFQVQRTFQQVCELAGIKKTIHELRHTYGTRMANKVVGGNDGKPIPIAELSRIMGHSKISTTQNFYVHSDEGQNEALLKSFANMKRRKLPKKT